MKRVTDEEVEVGQPLDWPVFDENNKLLMRKGAVISNAAQLSMLLSRGIYHGDEDLDSRDVVIDVLPGVGLEAIQAALAGSVYELDVFALVAGCMQRQRFLIDTPGTLFSVKIKDLCVGVALLCEDHADAVLATLHLESKTSYTTVHMLHSAVLCNFLAKREGSSNEERISLMAAAVTHDVGLADLRDELEKQRGPLTAEQREAMQGHPVNGVRFLKQTGVDDPIWLEAVHHHHERTDGTGYPDRLFGPGVTRTARMLAIADTYSAMTRDRSYKEAVVQQVALRELYQLGDLGLDSEQVQFLIKELGVFPPGAFVRLANNEIGIVVRRRPGQISPVVCTIISALGSGLPKPVERDCSLKEFKITEMVPKSRYQFMSLHLKQLWMTHPPEE